MNKKYVVRLSDEERVLLREIVSRGKAPSYRIKHAEVLMKVDADGPGWTDARAAKALACSARTIVNIRQRYIDGGLEAALGRKRRVRPPRAPILDGEKEARLIQLARSAPPDGRPRWTLQMLADTLVAMDVVDSISAPTVMRALRKARPGAGGARAR